MGLLVAGVVAVFGQVARHELVDFDDFIYLRDNPWMREPLDLAWIERALFEPHAAYWIPLTWLSYRIDLALFGEAPGGILLVNVALHAANVLLVHRIFLSFPGHPWRSAFVAAAFAFHPLHVESVAWASERKDVLSTFFFLLGMACYLHGRRVGGRRWTDLAVAGCLGLGLLAKPMLVTFPLALLILDFWPLARLSPRGVDALDGARIARVVAEKIPLLAMAFGAGLVVLSTQESMGGTSFTADRSLVDRIAHACIAYVWYLAKAVWPVGLSVIHPLSLDPVSRVEALAAASLLAAITIACLDQAERRPWLLAGWLWFLVHLAPVIGIIGVGMQAWADRWMYVPLLGPAWIVAWGVGEWVERNPGGVSRRIRRVVATAAAIGVIGAWGIASHRQVAVWKDTRTLFLHALEVDPENWFAHHRLAVWHRGRGMLAEAEHHYVASLRALPGQAHTQGELADVLLQQGKSGLAARLYANVSQTGLRDRRADLRLGRIFLAEGRFDDAAHWLARAALRRPQDEALARELERARLGGDVDRANPR